MWVSENFPEGIHGFVLWGISEVVSSVGGDFHWSTHGENGERWCFVGENEWTNGGGIEWGCVWNRRYLRGKERDVVVGGCGIEKESYIHTTQVCIIGTLW